MSSYYFPIASQIVQGPQLGKYSPNLLYTIIISPYFLQLANNRVRTPDTLHVCLTLVPCSHDVLSHQSSFYLEASSVQIILTGIK